MEFAVRSVLAATVPPILAAVGADRFRSVSKWHVTIQLWGADPAGRMGWPIAGNQTRHSVPAFHQVQARQKKSEQELSYLLAFLFFVRREQVRRSDQLCILHFCQLLLVRNIVSVHGSIRVCVCRIVRIPRGRVCELYRRQLLEGTEHHRGSYLPK